MCTLCPCDGTLGNTGTPSKQSVIKAGVKLIAVPLFDDSGARNQILSTDTLDSAFFDGKFENPDPSQRWYPIGQFQQVTSERADPSTESLNDGSNLITTQGIRTWQGWLIKYSTAYMTKLESHACGKFGVFILDECGDITGIYCKDGGGSGVDALRPIQVNEASVDVRYIMQQDQNVAKVQLTFEFAQIEKDASLRKILASDLVGVNILDYDGLLDLGITVSPATTASLTVATAFNYDSVFTNIPITGLADTAFSIFNTTTNTGVTIDSVTESPAGTYTLAVSSGLTSLDVATVKIVNSAYYAESTVTIA